MLNAYIEMKFDDETDLYESIENYDINVVKIPNQDNDLFIDRQLNVELRGEEDELRRWLIEHEGIDEDETFIFIQYYDSDEQ